MDQKPEQPIEDTSPKVETPFNPSGIDEHEQTSSDKARVSPVQPVTKKSKRLLYIILAIIFVVAVTCGVYFGLRTLQNSIVSSAAKTTKTTSVSQKTVESVTTTTSLDTTIDTNLKDIDNALTQASNDQAQVDSAMSDSNQQITVPTE